MFYVWQMNDGRWHVDAFTNAPTSARMLAFRAPGFDTRAEAEAHRQQLEATWADVRATAAALTA